MSAAAAAVALPVGALVGLGAGWLSVVLERVEGLEAEDHEDRAAFEREAEAAVLTAPDAGATPTTPPWPLDRYGWTGIEKILCPALGAIGFAAFAWHAPFGVGLVINLLWMAVFVQIFGFDLKHRLILNRVTYPAFVAALALSFATPGLTFVHALAGGAGIGAFFLLMNVLSRGGIGLGDAKLGALIGATCGIALDFDHIGAVYAVIYGIFLGGLVALMLLLLRVRSLKDPIPYGPFLCVGAAIVLFRGL